ncbi:MAG: glycosyltransferase family 4 protein [Leptolyngbyaceae cyanobacterium T60_A2020_046]|nr:glycosyltransferase family 4 protein [Leptolyngbyaceae cyanobacterium T60_A2020_046]
MTSTLVVNLSFLSAQPSGISNYALGIAPALASLAPTFLAPSYFEASDRATQIKTRDRLSSDAGRKGHFHRLMWTQFQCPKYLKPASTSLLFSPLPEAPLYSRWRFIVTAHDVIPLHFPRWRSPLYHYFQHYVPRVLHQAAHILCNSETTAADLTRFYGIPPHRMTAIPLGYDAQNFRPLDLPKQPYFLYLGRYDRHKNLGRLVDAFSQVQDHDCELWLVGAEDARYTPQIRALAEEKGVRDRVKIIGYAPYHDLPKLLSQAIGFVFPSLWEGFGLPVLEAMACGAPVITSNVSSLPEVAGEAALLVDPYHTEAIRDAMQQVLDDATLAQQLRHLGLQRASQFSWQKTGRATANLIQAYL